jgi:hypothetical protein
MRTTIYDVIPTQRFIVPGGDCILSFPLLLQADDIISVYLDDVSAQDFILEIWFSSNPDGKSLIGRNTEVRFKPAKVYPFQIQPLTGGYKLPVGQMYLNIRNISNQDTYAYVKRTSTIIDVSQLEVESDV